MYVFSFLQKTFPYGIIIMAVMVYVLFFFLAKKKDKRDGR